VARLYVAEGKQLDALVFALVTREQERVEQLGVIAVTQFGVHPEFFAEVMAALEMGSPMTTEQRAYIHSQFHQHLEELRRQYGGETGEQA
jgi:hypothetical protein